MFRMKIDFFTKADEINKTLMPAIYGIEIGRIDNDKTELIYIGQSFVPISRCGKHLNNIQYKKPNYLGFTDDILCDENLRIVFTIIENIPYEDFNTKKNGREIELIKQLSPALQNGISDRVYSDEKVRILKLKEAINKLN
ncbi:hypothetical protein ACQUD9_06685 [Vagococcus fluvialis]|uniref:hypothetical protein n=1 Tax=Vagococcus fluvialis TaxID=2738 RepID=UPI003D0D6A35